MTEATVPSSVSVKRRQYLLLGGIGATIVAGTVASVALTGVGADREPPARARSTNIMAPGAQVDPRDAWRGQADAQLRAIEQKSRELSQRDAELQGQSREMIERLRKIETSGLTPLPPSPVPAPAQRPNFGPDPVSAVPMGSAAQRPPGITQLPPPPPPPLRTGNPTTPTAALPAAPSGIISITLADPQPAGKSASAADPSTPTDARRNVRRYLPSGAFTRAVLLGGLDAPTGGQAQRNPQPVLMRLMDNAVLPNLVRSRVKECFVVGAGYGDVSSERAYIRTESLSCVARDGSTIDVPIKGYVAGEDGKAGMRGRLVSKQGQILANALLAGVASGIGQAFTQSSTTMSISPLGSTSTVEPGRQLEAGMSSGVGKALDRLAQYYITLAEKVFPVIEIDAGRSVDVVLTQGIALDAPLDPATPELQTYPQLNARTYTQRNAHENDD